MLRSVTIKNYKSILDDTIELGRINVFIGENGCGKSNILEALTFAAASMGGEASVEELYHRGIRVARPELMRSSFREAESGGPDVVVTCDFGDEKTEFRLREREPGSITSDWESESAETEWRRIRELLEQLELVHRAELLPLPPKLRRAFGRLRSQALKFQFSSFVIFNANILALRGLEVFSRREPLGIHGEGLDVLLGTLSDEEFAAVDEAMQCIRWVKSVELDKEGEHRFQGFKLGRSRSNLYFVDRFMADDNNVFSAESVNEGALYVLFYLALFSTRRTPSIFGIDNIDTALNPQLCRDLIKQVAILAKRTEKQALITTHNPAILDGLNLRDEDQRLFVVYRTDEGYTRTRRIKVKPDAPEPLKLSELWMRGYLGGLPQGF